MTGHNYVPARRHDWNCRFAFGPYLGPIDFSVVPSFAQTWRPTHDVVPTAFAAVGQYSAIQLVFIGERHNLDAAQPAEVGQLHDVAKVFGTAAFLVALQQTSGNCPVDESIHNQVIRQAALFALHRRFNAKCWVHFQEAAIAAPLQYTAQVAQHVSGFRWRAFVRKSINDPLHQGRSEFPNSQISKRFAQLGWNV
ncbi:helix-turn-helix domain-containing protein [Pseudomonas allii]|uniref:helix-turn-helix domain-containing protein n=1 Tax=Pseudomonas allii TaxID=2740531 RepID=UPI0035C6968A